MKSIAHAASVFYSLIFFMFCFLLYTPVKAQTPILFYNELGTGLSQPLDVVNAGDGSNRLFIVERGGRIKIFSGGVIQPVPFLDLTASGLVSLTGGERGLLSVAFHPDYENNGYFYIYYTRFNANPALDGDLEIDRFKVSSNPNLADLSSRKEVIIIPHHTYDNHNGGKLNFGHDTSLYLATGDGGGANDPDNNGQNPSSLLGKMLRLLINDSTDVAPFYTAPLDNPYATDAGVSKEIFSMGLRNPFRWSFDRNGTGPWDMWIGDVGQATWEEINFRAGGSQRTNFGWRCYEGNQVTPTLATPCTSVPADTVNPFYQYDHGSSGGFAVTGGIVYRGAAYPALQGWYSAVDFYTGNGWLIKADRTVPAQLQTGLPTGIAAFGESESREVYAVSLTQGELYQVQLAGIVPVTLASFTSTERNGQHQIRWTTAMEINMLRFDVQFSHNNSHFTTIYGTPAKNQGKGHDYSFQYPIAKTPDVFYRLAMTDKDGKVEYSNVLHLKGKESSVLITPTLVKDQKITIKTNTVFNGLQLIDMSGKVRLNRQQKILPGTLILQWSGLPKGMYIIRLFHAQGQVNQKILVE